MATLINIFWYALGGFVVYRIFFKSNNATNIEQFLPKGDQLPNYDHWGGPQGLVEGKTQGPTVPTNLKNV